MSSGVSIIIPTYNREKFIAEAITSVLEQNHDGKIEIIISDDGSTDNTLEIASQFGNKIKIIKKPTYCPKQGASNARNRGIKASSQRLICFLDSDDYFLPNHLKRMINILESNMNLGFVFCRILNVKEENGRSLFKEWTHRHVFKKDILNPVVSRNKIIHTNGLLLRSDIFNKVGYFDENYSNGEDNDLWMRISEQYNGSFSNHFGAVYRIQHSVTQLSNNPIVTINSCQISIIKNAIERYYDLDLKDSDRIFELKHLLIHDRYHNNKFAYLFKYIELISHYPISFFRKIPIYYYEFLENKRIKAWHDLQHFIG